MPLFAPINLTLLILPMTDMPQTTLDQIAIEEIRTATAGLKGKQLASAAKTLSVRFNVSVQTVYRVTEDTRPQRKTRTDKGKRHASLLEHPGLSMAAELVATRNVDPDLAMETARLNGHEIPVALGTMQRYLREHGLNKAARKANLRAHRRWEAGEPCEIFQFDISGVKERWFDLTTRKILHVSSKDVNENHPNKNPNRVKVWKFTLIDDYSRRRHFRFYPIDKPTSIEVIDFLLHAFRKLGVPKTLYTDNDAIIISKRMKRAESILHKAFEESGGFRLLQHTPHNAQATGKVERSHQVIEKFEKLIGLKFQTPSIEALNEFCAQVCDALDWQVHSTTGEKPMLRWQSKNMALRVPPNETLDAAFKCEEFTRRLNEDVTISYKGQVYQLPRKRPFVDWITKTITIIWPAGEADWFTVIGLDGVEYEISRTNANADAAGEFKQVEETTRQRSMKLLKEQQADRKAIQKETGVEMLVPGFDAAFEQNTEVRPAMMPKRVLEMSTEHLPAAQTEYTVFKYLKFWPAFQALVAEGALTTDLADKEFLRGVFNGREEITDAEIRTALDARSAAQPTTNVFKFERRA